MLIYLVDENNVHTPFACKQINYSAVPRVGEMIVADEKLYVVVAVYHNLDVQEVKIATKKVL